MTATKKRDEQLHLADALKVNHYKNKVFIRIDPYVLDGGYRQRAQCFLRAYAQKLQDENDFYDKLMRQPL